MIALEFRTSRYEPCPYCHAQGPWVNPTEYENHIKSCFNINHELDRKRAAQRERAKRSV